MRVILYTSLVLVIVTVMGVKSTRYHINEVGETATAAVIDKIQDIVIAKKPTVEATTISYTSQQTSTTDPRQIIDFAQTLIGTPYAYGSMDPSVGFDCSGFINYVAAHFNIKVPRSSVDFTNAGEEVRQEDARPGDLILFTGTDSTSRVVGHIGIITENPGGRIQFIHSSSGKANGVTISTLEGYYSSRFMKVIRILS